MASPPIFFVRADNDGGAGSHWLGRNVEHRRSGLDWKGYKAGVGSGAVVWSGESEIVPFCFVSRGGEGRLGGGEFGILR